MPSDSAHPFLPEPEQRRPDAARRAARVGGAVSLGLAAVQLAAPGRVCRLVGLPDTGSSRRLVRAVGVRELGVGVALFSDPRPSRWFWARTAGDAMDTAVGARILRSGDDRVDDSRISAATALAAATGVADAALALWTGRHQASDGRDDTDPPMRRVNAAITVNRPVDEVSAAWRDFSRLPTFMHHLRSVETRGEGLSRWTARAPLGRSVSWEAEVVTETPQLVAWESRGGAVRTSGSVRFLEAPGGRGTEVHVVVRYQLPVARLTDPLARLLGEAPGQQVDDDLRRFKQVLETGEIAVSDGSPQGHVARDQATQRPAQPVEHRSAAPTPSNAY